MQVIYKKPCREGGELRAGFASWDKGKLKSHSVKWAYKAKDDRIARTSPEVSPEILVELVVFAKEVGLLDDGQLHRLSSEFSKL